MTPKARVQPFKPKPANPQFLKYLKPGALALIRDSRISAKTHRLTSLSLNLLALSDLSQPLQVNVINNAPCFSPKRLEPCCPQRKKIAAVNSVLCFNPTPPAPVTSSNNEIVSL